MTILLKNNYSNTFSSITYYGIIVVVIIHLLGYLNLKKWLSFSGIGTDAEKIEGQYGYVGLIILNAMAVVTFVIIALIYNHRRYHPIFLYMTYIIISAFTIRGLMGYVFITIGKIGTATPFWEFVFSTMAFIIGLSGILEFRVE